MTGETKGLSQEKDKIGVFKIKILKTWHFEFNKIFKMKETLKKLE